MNITVIIPFALEFSLFDDNRISGYTKGTYHIEDDHSQTVNHIDTRQNNLTYYMDGELP